jgi:hypothetical protein
MGFGDGFWDLDSCYHRDGLYWVFFTWKSNIGFIIIIIRGNILEYVGRNYIKEILKCNQIIDSVKGVSLGITKGFVFIVMEINNANFGDHKL